MRIYELKIRDKEFTIKVKSFTANQAELEVNGETMQVAVKAIGDDMVGKPVARPTPVAAPSGGRGPAKATPTPKASASAGALTAPIPGAILEIFVKEGQEVKAGQPVLKMEAMKMENIISATQDGTVLSISVQPKDAVSQGQELMMIG